VPFLLQFAFIHFYFVSLYLIFTSILTKCVCLATVPGKARRVPVTANEDETEMKDTEAEESELADSDVENKLNPDEYEDDTTEFEQSEVAGNDSQNEVSIHSQPALHLVMLVGYKISLCSSS